MKKIISIWLIFMLVGALGATILEIDFLTTELNKVIRDLEKYKAEIIIMKGVIQKVHEVRGIYERDIPLPLDLQFHTYLVCERFNADYDLVLAIMRAESDYQINAINIHEKGTDYGIMQINEVHLNDFKKLGYTDVFNPYQNIEYAVKFLMSNADVAENEHQLAMAYHYGRKGMRELVAEGFTETNYSRKVLQYKEELKNAR